MSRGGAGWGLGAAMAVPPSAGPHTLANALGALFRDEEDDLRRRHEEQHDASPCPDLEARAAEIAAVESWEVEPDSGPISRRGEDVELIAYVATVGS